MTQQTYTPDWSKAPTDANWHARDSDGCGFWYNKRPAQSRGFWAAGCSLTIADNDCPVLDHDAALDNWRDTLTVRPFQDRDIPQNLSDYFSGKTTFITAYVDLLLARMANEDRFSDGSELTFSNAQPFDIFTINQKHITKDWDTRYLIVFSVKNEDVGCLIIGLNITQDNGVYWGGMWNTDTSSDFIKYCRPITELEADQFRRAMEAVYG